MQKIAANINTPDYWDSLYCDRSDRGESDDLHKIMDMVYSIEDGKSVIDLGCGTGHFLRAIKQHRPHCQLTGVDYSGTVINRLKQTDPGIEWLEADVTDTGLNKKYDYVLSFETIEHLDEPAALISEIARLSQWRTIITCPYDDSFQSREHVWKFDGDDLKVMFNEHFSRVWVMPVGSGKGACRAGVIVRQPGHWDLIYLKAEK